MTMTTIDRPIPPVEESDPQRSTDRSGARARHAPVRHASPAVLPPPTGAFTSARARLSGIVGYLGPSLGKIYLIPHPWIGVLIWAALAWYPRNVGFALIGLALAIVAERALRIEEETWVGGGLKANALMASLAAGWMTDGSRYPAHVQIGIAVAVASCAFVITGAIMRAVGRARVPSLLWGFCITAGAMFSMFPGAVHTASARYDWWQAPLNDAPAWGRAFFQSIGALVFAPTIATGALILLAVLLWSRKAAIAGIVGWLAGAWIATQLTKLGVTYYWLSASYNFFVTGMAVGAFFILPAYSSALLAALAGIGSSLVGVAMQAILPNFAYLPLPSALTIWWSLALLTFAKNRPELWRNSRPSEPPEEAWWTDEAWSRRFGRNEPLLTIPVAGTVTVAQGFDGSLSHVGDFRHALDFMRLPASNEERATEAIPKTTIWDAPVTAPAAGFIDRVRNDVPDNPWGLANFAEPWGNHVSIRLDQGGWALLAHLRRGSIAVTPGMRVEIGTHIAAAGNSGRSPMPHLHLHVQDGPAPGSRTIPFRLANYLSGPTSDGCRLDWHAADIPRPESLVSASSVNPAAYTTLTSLAPGLAVWSVQQKGKVPRSFRERHSTIQVEHEIDEWGRHILTTRSSKLLLALAPDAWRVIEQRGRSPFLRLLASGVPSIPYCVEPNTSWTDIVPAVPSSWLRLALAPYQQWPFDYAHSMCVQAPTAAGEPLVVETALRDNGRLPDRIVCTLDRVRGPIELEATFEEASLRYSLVSFSPGMSVLT